MAGIVTVRAYHCRWLCVVGIALVIGVLLGALAGFFGGWVDLASRALRADVRDPTFLLLITIGRVPEASIFYTMIIIGLTGWVGMARFTRNEFFKGEESGLCYSATAIGLPDRRICFRHILPNALPPSWCPCAGIASAILAESGPAS